MKKVDKIKKLMDKPQLSIEKAVLTCIMLDNDEIINVLEHVTEEMFSYEPNLIMFRIMKSLYENKRAIDANIVWSEILRLQKNNAFLTEDYVLSLVSGEYVVYSKNAKDYATALEGSYGKIKAKEFAEKVKCGILEKNMTIQEATEYAQNELLKLSKMIVSDIKFNKLDYNSDELDALLDEKLRDDVISGLSTGIYDLDMALDGLQSGRVYGLIADSGVGKSKMAKQISLHNGKKGKNVFFGSFEMSTQELTLDMACMNENISSNAVSDTKSYINHLISKGMYNSKESALNSVKTRLRSSVSEIKELPVSIFEHDEPNISIIINAINKYVLQNGHVDLIIIDHTDLIHSGNDIVNELRYIYKKLKDISKKFKCPVLALHQFNNELKDNKDRFPNVFNIAGGRGIRNNCDVLMMMYRPEIYSDLIKEKPELRGVCQLIIDKLRYKARPKEPIDLKFNGIKFSDMMDISR